MAGDSRIRRAKRVLSDAKIRALEIRDRETSRSTGSRAAYKVQAQAADKALEILCERAPPK